MLNDRSRWCLITTYKENYLLLPAILSYYKGVHGIPRFLIFCGLIGSHSHTSLKQLIAAHTGSGARAADATHETPGGRSLTVSEFTGDGFVLWVASYPTAALSTDLEWTAIRSDLEKWACRFLPAEVTRTLLIDNDEFLYIKDPHALQALDGLGFHFLDVVPGDPWPPRTLKFSLQGWYYRRQARPLFRYGGPVSVNAARRLGRGLEHSGCKTYYFDRDRLASGTAWHHGGTQRSLACCFALDRFLPDIPACQEIIRNTCCCYHLGMTSSKHFLSQKLHLFGRIQTDMKRIPIPNPGRSPETRDLAKARATFDKFIAVSKFPVIEDNFLLPYLGHPIDENIGAPAAGS